MQLLFEDKGFDRECYQILKTMQEQEKIRYELAQLQTECVKQYLETKLQAITTKEVLNDILQEFMQVNNVQFIQNVTENIIEVKNDNKLLRKQLEFLRITHSHQFEALKEKIIEEYRQANGQMYQKQTHELTRKVNAQLIEISDLQEKSKCLEAENKQLVAKCQQLLETNKSLAEEEKEMRSKYSSVKIQSENIRQQISKMEENSSKFKAQCQELLKYNNQQRQEDSLKLNESFNAEKKILEQNISCLEKKIEQINKQLSQESQAKQVEISNLVDQLSSFATEKDNVYIQFEHFKTQTFQEHQNYACTIDNLEQLNAKLNNDLESLQLSQKYLQEENQYLREQIITFRNRYSALEDEKTKIEHQFELFRQNSNKEIELVNIARLNIQQQFKEQLNTTVEKYSQEMNLLRSEIQSLIVSKQQVIEHTEQQQNELESLKNEIKQLKQENQCMSTQLSYHFNQNQVHQKELKACEDEIVRINQQCRAQIQTLKQTYELTWNELNEELHQQKYQNKIQREINSKLTEDLAVEKDKQYMYQLYLQENGHLKRQLSILATKGRQLFDKQELKIGQGKQKFIYYIKKINLELTNLKEENKKLKEKVFKQVKEYQQYFQQHLTMLISKIKEESTRCSYCQHKNSLKAIQSKKIPDFCFQKTIPKGHNNQSFSSLKKSLRNIQQRYQSINQQNKYYSEHIETIIKHA